MIDDKPDLITLLMAISLLHVYRSFSEEELKLLQAVDLYKETLMNVPYEDPSYKVEDTRETKHIKRVLKAHELTYKELISQC